MEFRIADTFTDSLARLTGDEQKAAKTTAFDLQMDPTSPGLSFHKLEKARDRNFHSVRVSRDIRLIVHKTQSSILLCYVDHHDKAFAWGERRRLEAHPKTGAAQMVEIRETIQEILVPHYVSDKASAPVRKQPFAEISDDILMGFGVPAESLNDVKAADEDSLLVVAEHLPAEAAEALLELAVGGTPARGTHDRGTLESGYVITDDESIHSLRVEDAGEANLYEVRATMHSDAAKLEASFEHPDAQRRFRTIESLEELQRALDFPWDKWTVFLHPEQRALVEREQSGPARVLGSAGTGKTIVALHRAVHLAKEYPQGRVMLATYSEPLANALAVRLRRLISNEPRLGVRPRMFR